MEIVVCVKQVPDSQNLEMDSRTNTLNRANARLVSNPADVSAMEAARATQKMAGGRIRAISMGPPSAEEALRQASRQGADRLILATDPDFAGGDTFATAVVLRAAILATGSFDLVLCGRRAIDGETGQVGGELAALLGVPCLTNVIMLRPEGLGLICVCLTDRGTIEVAAPLPILVTICESYSECPPNLADIGRASRIQVERLDKVAINLNDGSSRTGLRGSKTRVRKMFTHPRSERTGKMLQDLKSMVSAASDKIAEATNSET